LSLKQQATHGWQLEYKLVSIHFHHLPAGAQNVAWTANKCNWQLEEINPPKNGGQKGTLDKPLLLLLNLMPRLALQHSRIRIKSIMRPIILLRVVIPLLPINILPNGKTDDNKQGKNDGENDTQRDAARRDVEPVERLLVHFRGSSGLLLFGRMRHRLLAAEIFGDRFGNGANVVVRILLETWLENTRFKKNQPSGFFWDFLYICPEERVFRVFSVSRILLDASRRKKL
jgi:hypothetical protein